MRRTLARTRDTLDAQALPPVENTELNHRTRVWTDSEERHYTIRVLLYLTIKVVFSAFVIQNLTLASVPLIAACFLPLALLMLGFALSRYIRGWPVGIRITKSISYVVTFLVIVVMSFIGDVRAAYLAFGAAVCFAAYLSRVIAKQYAFFMAANDRLRVRTVRRWQGVWFEYPRLKFRGTRFLPEVSDHARSFPLLLLPYACGFVALILAERSALAWYAGAIGIAAFIATVPVVWFAASDLGFTPHAPFFHSVHVCWRGLVTWFCYNYHQTPAAGVFQFPTRWTRNPNIRNLAVFCSLSMFAMTALSAGTVGSRNGLRNLMNRPASSPRRYSPPEPSENATRILPHEKIFMEQLPEAEQGSYRQRLLDRRRQEEARASAKRWSPSHHLGDDWLIRFAFTVAFCFAAPLPALFVVYWFVSGRLLTAYYDALEAPDGHQQSTEKSPWDNRVERLLSSRDELEAEHLYMGRSYYGDYPVLLHRDLLDAHAHILGDTGSRKTSIGMAPMLTQLIAREDSSVLIIDLKGDMGLFQCAMAEAKAAGIPFKWFTNITERSSYVFNPFAQSHMHRLTINQKTQGILQALSLEFGEGYGEAYFSAMHEIVLATYMRKYRNIGSFQDLYNYMKDKNAYRGIGDLDDWEKARHLTTLANKLAEVYPLNLKPADFPARPKLFEKQIDMPSLLSKRQVIYFYLASTLEPTTVSPVAKLAMFALLTAAARRSESEPNRVYVFLDEFQRIISENVKIFLEQARSMKLHFILANQTAGQLESSGTDLTETVDSCTAFKQSFKATDLKSLKKLEESSGEALYHSADWTEAIDAGLREAADDEFDIGHLPTGIFDSSGVGVKEAAGPRLERNTIIELSAKPMASFVRFTEGSGYTQFSGYYTPILSEYHISKDSFKARSKAPWPEDSEETVIGHAESGETPERMPFLTGHPGGPPPPENVPDDFDRHLEERLTGPEVPKPAKPPKSR